MTTHGFATVARKARNRLEKEIFQEILQVTNEASELWIERIIQDTVKDWESLGHMNKP